jgi:CRP-like cAMP-binding protein
VADPKIKELQRVGLFARCSKPELETLAQNADEVDLPAGRTLVVEGKSNDTFYLLLDGSLDVQIKGERRRRLNPGDVFGEISMLDQGAATATVTTVTPVRALVMSHVQFRDAVRAQENIAVKVIAVMAERLRDDQRAGI